VRCFVWFEEDRVRFVAAIMMSDRYGVKVEVDVNEELTVEESAIAKDDGVCCGGCATVESDELSRDDEG
jgi:hypothetical protein